ncbi:MAG: hypothetical protein NZ519_03815 [Bacteroidia bacterium]|nr:hypothetical protein [Bacteroidia bacterium]MDW8302964.1 hypothetical protein [Bacteroidia bacterium]
MNIEWKTIDEFNYEIEAQPLIDLLTYYSIPYQMERVQTTFNPTFLRNPIFEKIVINVPDLQYEEALALWQKAIECSKWCDFLY